MPLTPSIMIRFFLHNKNKIFVSDLPIEKVHKKIGLKYEILNTIKEKESVEILKQRLLLNYPQATFDYHFVVERKLSAEAKAKIGLSKVGKPRPEWVRQKISNSKKGISQFAGKKHTEETKRIMAIKKLGNDHVKDTIWIHDPRGSEENRIKDLKNIKRGFSKGRDYYAVEGILNYTKNKRKLRPGNS